MVEFLWFHHLGSSGAVRSGQLLVWSWTTCRLSPHQAGCAVETSWKRVAGNLHLPLEEAALEGGGEVFHLATSSDVQLDSQRLLSRGIRPILVRFPSVLFRKLCDHYNHRHLSERVCKRLVYDYFWSINKDIATCSFWLYLDYISIETFSWMTMCQNWSKLSGLGACAAKKCLLTVRKCYSTGIHIVDLKQITLMWMSIIKGNFDQPWDFWMPLKSAGHSCNHRELWIFLIWYNALI